MNTDKHGFPEAESRLKKHCHRSGSRRAASFRMIRRSAWNNSSENPTSNLQPSTSAALVFPSWLPLRRASFIRTTIMNVHAFMAKTLERSLPGPSVLYPKGITSFIPERVASSFAGPLIHFFHLYKRCLGAPAWLRLRRARFIRGYSPLRLLRNLRETFLKPGEPLALAAFLNVEGLLVFGVWFLVFLAVRTCNLQLSTCNPLLVFLWSLEVGVWCFVDVAHPRA
jgi:hypothetical protein